MLRAVHTASDLSKELTRLAQKLLKVTRHLSKLQEAVEMAGKNILPAMAKATDMSMEAPGYHQADEAKGAPRAARATAVDDAELSVARTGHAR